MKYLAVKNWTSFQHYKNRRPPWIKFHVSLLSDRDLSKLPVPTQLLYDRLLLLAAMTDNRIPNDPVWISEESHLPSKVVREGITKLLKSGFLSGFSRKPRASTVLSSRASARSPEAEAEKALNQAGSTEANYEAADLNRLNDERYFAVNRLLAVLNDKDEGTPRVIAHFAGQLPPGSIEKVRESVLSANGVSSRTAYAVSALKSEIKERA